MGEDRQDRPGHPSGRRASVREAAELLGTTVDAIRKRVQRGTIPYEKASDGRVWIVLDAVQDSTGHRQDTDRSQSDSTTLTSELRDRLRYVEEQLEAERQAHAEARRIIAGLVERIPAIEAPLENAPQSSESPGPTDTPQEAPEEPQEGIQRPWRSLWRRILRG